jgi:nickel transport protein
MGVTPTIPTPVANQSASAARTGMSNDLRQEMAAMIRDELRPLRREIAASREHANLQSILGGIGYIMGLFGFGFYIAARRKLGE